MKTCYKAPTLCFFSSNYENMHWTTLKRQYSKKTMLHLKYNTLERKDNGEKLLLAP